MDLFRAAVRAGERSERVLALTRSVIDHNAANYTAWHVRRLCLFALGKDLGDELAFCLEVGERSAKNYQLTHHRRIVVDRVGSIGDELDVTAAQLRSDPKNYHAWQHRQWALRRFERWGGELDFVDGLLGDDVRNNSAWNHRHLVVQQTGGFTAEVVSREIAYARARIEAVPRNESAWNYVRALAAKPAATDAHRAEVVAICEACGDACVPALAALVDLDARSGDAGRAERARAACRRLAEEADPVRAEYWRIREAEIASG